MHNHSQPKIVVLLCVKADTVFVKEEGTMIESMI